MQTTKDIEAFGRACEHLLASVHIHRPLTEAEVLFVRHYCKELQETIAPLPTIPTVVKNESAVRMYP